MGEGAQGRRWPVTLIAAVVVAGVCLLDLANLTWLRRLEWMTYDARVKLARRVPGPNQLHATNLGLVEITDETIDSVNNGEQELGFSYGLYWPRTVYALALRELSLEGARTVGFDVLFSGLRPNDPSPPETVKLGTGAHPTNADEFFAAELEECGNAILAADEGVLPAPLFRFPGSKLGNITTDKDLDGVLRRERPYEEFREWQPLIREMARQLDLELEATVIGPTNITFFRKRGDEAITLPTDKDGFIDTRTIVGDAGGALKILPFTPLRVWSMGIVLAASELKLDLDNAQIEPEHHRIVLRGPQGVSRVIPLDADGCFQINWELDVDHPALASGSLGELLIARMERGRPNGEEVTNRWKDKLIMIGSTATGSDLSDLGPSPLGSQTHLVTKHLNVANSIIANRFVSTSPRWLRWALIAAMGALAAWINLAEARPLTGMALMTAVDVVYGSVACWLCVE